jgi:hypothetical protein
MTNFVNERYSSLKRNDIFKLAKIYQLNPKFKSLTQQIIILKQKL